MKKKELLKNYKSLEITQRNGIWFAYDPTVLPELLIEDTINEQDKKEG